MSRRCSKLLDRGNEAMLVYPVIIGTDRLGNAVKHPDNDNPIIMRVNVSTDRQASAELPGQVDIKILKISVRTFPVDSFDRIELRGEEWDLAIPPTVSQFSRATRHVSIVLRARNRKVH